MIITFNPSSVDVIPLDYDLMNARTLSILITVVSPGSRTVPNTLQNKIFVCEYLNGETKKCKSVQRLKILGPVWS